MKILISTLPYVGHFNPTQPIAIELVNRGHEVLWMSGPAYEEKILTTGARFKALPPDHLIDDDLVKPDPGLTGLAALRFLLRKLYIDRIPIQVRDYRETTTDFPADILLVDWCTYGAHTFHDLTGTPYATLGINPLATPDPEIPPYGQGSQPPRTFLGRWLNIISHSAAASIIFPPLNKLINEERTKLGLDPLPPAADFTSIARSHMLHIMPTTPAFEFPRRNLHPSVKFVGPLLPPVIESEFVPPSWWNELRSHQRRKVVHITQGTIAIEGNQLLRPAVLALETETELLVIVTGKNAESLFGVGADQITKPANVRLASFVPHRLLLPHVGIMVTNAGYNGVLTALSHGVPMVCAGRVLDKADVSSRVQWVGAGLNLGTEKPTVAQLRQAILKIMGDEKYTLAAETVMRNFAEHNGPAEAVEEIEQLVENTTKRSGK